MSEIEIDTPRGATLSGTFISPVDSTNAAVLFSHSFLSDRTSGTYFTKLAAIYRSLGYATLLFDYSGHGKSSDSVVTMAACEEDLRSAAGWLADQGFGRQLLHGHSFGTVAALRARPSTVKTMFLSGAVLGPLSYEWQQIFSAGQFDELETTGIMTILDDSPGPRKHFRISQQTLRDLSLTDPESLIDGIEIPVLIVHDAEDEAKGLLQLTMEVFSRLPDGSRVKAFQDVSFGQGEHLERLYDAATTWATKHLPIR